MNAVMFCNRNRPFQIYINIIAILNPCIIDQNIYLSDFGGVMTELNRPVMEDEKLWDQIMELTPLKRWMSVEEAAEWIYFMAVKNRFCTGQNILIDGLEAGNCNFIWP